MTPQWFTRPLQLGDRGGDVRVVRRKLGLPDGNEMDDATVAHLLGATGQAVVTEEVAELFGESAADAAELTPEWFTRPLRVGDYGSDVDVLRGKLGLPAGIFDWKCDAAVRRVQSAARITPTGVVDAEVARIIGDV